MFDVDGVLVDSPPEWACRDTLLMETDRRDAQPRTNRTAGVKRQAVYAGKPRPGGAPLERRFR
jgi:hypothetical protein